MVTNKDSKNHNKLHFYSSIKGLGGMAAHSPLLLAPVEGLGSLRAPCQVGVIYFKKLIREKKSMKIH